MAFVAVGQFALPVAWSFLFFAPALRRDISICAPLMLRDVWSDPVWHVEKKIAGDFADLPAGSIRAAPMGEKNINEINDLERRSNAGRLALHWSAKSVLELI
jgi:hypothetical protein